MYKAVFQNSKIALAFVILTIISAVSMVGTSDDGGVLVRLVSLVNARSASNAGVVGQRRAAQRRRASLR
jgi:hypothetical protein